MIESYMLEMGQMTIAHLSDWVLQMSFLRVKHILMAALLVCTSYCRNSLQPWHPLMILRSLWLHCCNLLCPAGLLHLNLQPCCTSCCVCGLQQM